MSAGLRCEHCGFRPEPWSVWEVLGACQRCSRNGAIVDLVPEVELRAKAKTRYRIAWDLWRRSVSQETKQRLQQMMDRWQPFIADGPGAEWTAFARTLPGFLEMWSNPREVMRRMGATEIH